MNIHFNFKQDVEGRDGKRYICVELLVQLPADKNGLFGDLQIAVWVPFAKGATVDQIRTAAIRAAQQRCATFAKVRRSEMTFGLP